MIVTKSVFGFCFILKNQVKWTRKCKKKTIKVTIDLYFYFALFAPSNHPSIPFQPPSIFNFNSQSQVVYHNRQICFILTWYWVFRGILNKRKKKSTDSYFYMEFCACGTWVGSVGCVTSVDKQTQHTNGK